MNLQDTLIISTNCIAGFIYRDHLKKEYEHPFIWSIIKLSDFITLIKNFNTIDFSNSTATYAIDEIINRDGNKFPKIVTNVNNDTTISTYFIHYIQVNNPSVTRPRQHGIRTITNNVLQYTQETWDKRITRLPIDRKDKNKVYIMWQDGHSTNIPIQEFINLANERKNNNINNETFVIFYDTDDKDNENILNSQTDNLIILPITDYNNVPLHAETLYNILTQ